MLSAKNRLLSQPLQFLGRPTADFAPLMPYTRIFILVMKTTVMFDVFGGFSGKNGYLSALKKHFQIIMIDGIHFIDIFAIAITAHYDTLASRQNFCENFVIPQSDAIHE